MRDRHLSRRSFLRNLAIAAPASSLIVAAPSLAQDLPPLATDDPQAAALMYVEDASASTAPNFKPGSNCANCALIQGNDGDAYRPCAIFPGKSVASAGWCSAWAAKP
ncbi:MAG: high-potential iron sulfur protein 2 [Gammaproteobacteria bacterium]|nr:high-potential iron sulfur protein 2 [Gammaproteobacteria bacterium]